MSKKQALGLIAPLFLIVSMYGVYRLLAQTYGNRLAWYLGFWIYWGFWCTAFTFLMIGKRRIAELIRPRKPDSKILLLVAFPLVMAVLFRILTGSSYSKPSVMWTGLLLSTAFGNGFFEEVLWRGLYMELFPERIFYRVIWPALWFALWHYSPGSLSPNTNVIGVMAGSGLFGLYLAYLALRTKTIWWCIVAHILGGIVMIS
jgi:membrane protease YdiL (CAAX protease family)